MHFEKLNKTQHKIKKGDSAEDATFETGENREETTDYTAEDTIVDAIEDLDEKENTRQKTQ